MNSEAQEYLNKILAKEPETLNQVEVGFLRARKSYLKQAQLEEYDNILNPKVKNQTFEESETVKETNAKKSK